jgi:Leucine-rich repeat (LRR) protein
MYKLMCIAWLGILSISLAAADAPPPVVQTEAGKKSLARISQLGGLALELAQNDKHLEVSYLQIDGKWTDEPLALLKDLKGVVHLNLRGQPVTDAQLVHLKPLTELTHLHLEKTKITDKGLENLKGLVNLEYLNLYGTTVSDAGLSSLEGMK